MEDRTVEYKGVKITLFGHASVKIKGNKVIYIDPYILPEGEVEKADLVIFTHGHFDHCVDPSRIMKEDTITIGCDCRYASRDIRPGDHISLEGIEIEAVYAYNPNKPFHPKGAGVGVIIEIDGVKIYHTGDTEYIPEMEELKGKVDVALLPIGGTYTMDVGQAVKAADIIEPKLVIPMHYNVIEGTEADPEEFKRKVESLGKGIKVEILY